MIEVNNFDKIKNLLKFDGKSIYLVWLVLRNKDGNTSAKGNNRNRTIKSYYFQDMDHFLEREQEIIDICRIFNCRAYICVNRKPLYNVLFEIEHNVMERIRQSIHGKVPTIHGILDHAVMKSGTEGRRIWVVDIDDKDENVLNDYIDKINNARSEHDNNVIDILPTAHGFHLITYPFDFRDIKGVEIKKEGLTLLYACLES